jgi:hypothetical protein
MLVESINVYAELAHYGKRNHEKETSTIQLEIIDYILLMELRACMLPKH